jgi:lincosamide nucleotidyltransferase A/C/D/E
MAMEASDVVEIIAIFDRAAIDVWVEGGWGVDALIGNQSRDHGDLDLMVDAPRSDEVRRLLEESGFHCIFEDPPGRFAYEDALGRNVDLSISAADRYGDRWNLNRRLGRGEPDYPFDCFVYGWIAGHKVWCIGPETQVIHHLGYEPEPVDTFDMELLREKFDVSIPEPLRPIV